MQKDQKDQQFIEDSLHTWAVKNGYTRPPTSGFHFDITMEDSRLEAHSDDGLRYKCVAHDNFNKTMLEFECTPEQITDIVALMTHPDGTPEGHERMYKNVEPLFEGWPNSLQLEVPLRFL